MIEIDYVFLFFFLVWGIDCMIIIDFLFEMGMCDLFFGFVREFRILYIGLVKMVINVFGCY